MYDPPPYDIHPTDGHGAKDDTCRFALYRRIIGRTLASLQAATDETRAEHAARRLRRDIDVITREVEKERQRGLAGHWTYDPNRLAALRQARDLAMALHDLQLAARRHKYSPFVKRKGRPVSPERPLSDKNR